MHSLFFSSLWTHDASPTTQLVVEGFSSGENTPSRIGTIAPTPSGTRVRIIELGGRKSKQLDQFRARSTDEALALVKSHTAMADLELRTVR